MALLKYEARITSELSTTALVSVPRWLISYPDLPPAHQSAKQPNLDAAGLLQLLVLLLLRHDHALMLRVCCCCNSQDPNVLKMDGT